MTRSNHHARHRASRRPRTPLDDAARSVAAGASATGRRYGVAMVSSSFLVTLAAPASAAVPLDHPSETLQSIDVAALTAAARTALATSPTVVVPVDTTWTFDAPVLTVTANPEPEPVVPAPRTAPPPSAATPPVAAPGGQVPASANGSAIIEIAARYVGIPYVYGGTTPDGFDCSGFTSYVYAQLGITLSRGSADQRYDGVEVPRDQAQPGDLVWSPGHVGIFAGGNTMIDSPRPGKSVQFREMWQTSPIFIRVSS